MDIKPEDVGRWCYVGMPPLGWILILAPNDREARFRALFGHGEKWALCSVESEAVIELGPYLEAPTDNR